MTKPLGPIQTHYWLAQSMAKASGADLVQAFADGRLSQDEWAAMVHRCRGCDWAERCKCWLGDTEWGGVDVPDACQNQDMMTKLASRHK